MKSFIITCVALFLTFISFGQESISTAPLGTDYSNTTGYQTQLNAPETVITHSSDQSITVFNSVSCNAGGLHADNSYYMVYDMDSEIGANSYFTINHIEVAIEDCYSAGGTQPVEIRIHTLDGTMSLANLTQIYSESFSVPDQSLSFHDFVFTSPVVVPEGSQMVVEIFTPNGQGVGNGFFIGSNATAIAADTYLRAGDCGISEPTTTTDIGFPDMNMVVNVYGLTGSAVPFPYALGASVFVLIALTVFVKRRFF